MLIVFAGIQKISSANLVLIEGADYFRALLIKKTLPDMDQNGAYSPFSCCDSYFSGIIGSNRVYPKPKSAQKELLLHSLLQKSHLQPPDVYDFWLYHQFEKSCESIYSTEFLNQLIDFLK